MIADKKRLISNVDKMAWDHLVSIGAICKAEPKPKAIRKTGRGSIIAWKKLDATNRFGCDQCGAGEYFTDANGNYQKTGLTLTKDGAPYGMTLCSNCMAVHLDSIRHGLKPSDEVPF